MPVKDVYDYKWGVSSKIGCLWIEGKKLVGGTEIYTFWGDIV